MDVPSSVSIFAFSHYENKKECEIIGPMLVCSRILCNINVTDSQAYIQNPKWKAYTGKELMTDDFG